MGGVSLRGDAEGLRNEEEAGGAAIVAFGFEGKVWWWGGAMEASAPGEAGATDGGGEGAVVEMPGAAVWTFEEPGLGAGGIGGGREDEEELAAGFGDVCGEGDGETGEGARHAGKGEGIGLACKRDV